MFKSIKVVDRPIVKTVSNGKVVWKPPVRMIEKQITLFSYRGSAEIWGLPDEFDYFVVAGVRVDRSKAVSRYGGVEINDYNTAYALYQATGGTGSGRFMTAQIFGGGKLSPLIPYIPTLKAVV